MNLFRITGIRSLAMLTLVISGLVGYQFMSAQTWTNAPSVPPNNNVGAPLNTGTVAQDKQGVLGASGLVAFGGGVSVINSSPTVAFDDTDTDNNIWWLNSNAYNGSNGRIHFLYDRNENNAWDAGDTSPSLTLESGATPAEDYALFSNQVRATAYCDQNGTNCISGGTAALGGTWRQYFEGSASFDTTVANTAFCAVQASWNGGCDSGFQASIQPGAGGYYEVRQVNRGDCDNTPWAVYACIGDIAPDTRTYSWSAGNWGSCRPNGSCTYAGTQTRSVNCKVDGTGAPVPDSLCGGTKPKASQSCTASYRTGHDC